MLCFADFSDYCDLNDEEIETISSEAGISMIEACAMAHEAEDDPKQSREVLKMMHKHLEQVEHQGDAKHSRELHDAISHFAARHKFI